MPNDFEFCSTEEELFRALRLAFPSPTRGARREAVVAALSPGCDWATSETTMILLSLGSETGQEKVEDLRRQEQATRRVPWMRDRPAGVSSEQRGREWDLLVAEEDRAWAALRESTRRSLTLQDPEPPS
jgi:hypothetical protein